MNAREREAVTEALRRLAAGDRSAFDEAFRLLWPVVSAYCTRLLGGADSGRDVAQDVAQEVMVKVLERSNTFDPDRDGLTWVLTLATWECRTARRKQVRQRWALAAGPGDAPLDARTPDADPETLASTEEQLRSVAEWVNELPEAHRATLERALLGTGPTDAAERKRKQRVLAQLARWWEMFHGRA